MTERLCILLLLASALFGFAYWLLDVGPHW